MRRVRNCSSLHRIGFNCLRWVNQTRSFDSAEFHSLIPLSALSRQAKRTLKGKSRRSSIYTSKRVSDTQQYSLQPMQLTQVDQNTARKPIERIGYHAHVVDLPKGYILNFFDKNLIISDQLLDELHTKLPDSNFAEIPRSEEFRRFLNGLERQFEAQILAEGASLKGESLECLVCHKKAMTLVHKIRFAGLFNAGETWEPSIFDKAAPWCGEGNGECKGVLEVLVREKKSSGEVSMNCAFFEGLVY